MQESFQRSRRCVDYFTNPGPRGPTVSVRFNGLKARFTRPETRSEPQSYPIPTHAACRGMLRSILGKDAMDWNIEQVHVLNEPVFVNTASNEVKNFHLPRDMSKLKLRSGIVSDDDRTQRCCRILYNVDYIVSAHLWLTPSAKYDKNPNPVAKFMAMFFVRITKGSYAACRRPPYFGISDYPAGFQLWNDPFPKTIPWTEDFGMMYFDTISERIHPDSYESQSESYYHPMSIQNGIVSYPTWRQVVSRNVKAA